MKQRSTRVEKVTKRLVKYIADQEVYTWPPRCLALYYQPVRPRKNKKEESSGQHVKKCEIN